MSDTPETDAVTDADFHKVDDEFAPVSAYDRLADLCREIETQRDKAEGECREARQVAAYWRARRGMIWPVEDFPWES